MVVKIGHQAAGRVKRLCGDFGKPFTPLRSASLASFVAALAEGASDPKAQGW